MLENALFKKHTNLILYMAARRYFSQKELINWCLLNKEFKDKDSIENKGQFRDKLIKLRVLKKYAYKEFLKIHPDEIKSASTAYTESQERKRCILEFDSGALIALNYPELRDMVLPFQEFSIEIMKPKPNLNISEIVKAFVFGCSIQGILLFNGQFSENMKLLTQVRPEIDEEHMPLVETAKKAMEKMIKENIAKKQH